MIQDVPARSSDAATFNPSDLLIARSFPHAVQAFEVRETHTSWVILTGPFAYKIKKPLELDFIDTSTLAKRRRCCEEELRLNRRLAPEIYLDVVEIRRWGGHLQIGGDGDIVEYAVRMKQFSAREELPSLIENTDVTTEEIARLAERLACFHRDAPIAPAGLPEELSEGLFSTVLGNLADLNAYVGAQHAAAVQRLDRWAHEQARALEDTFRLREQSGCIRECHGDLHAANIVRWQNSLIPYDCLEFDPRLRWIDVISDIAFLAMDLAGHYRPDLAFTLLSRYLEITGDYEAMRVLRFYAVHRALVRAKVDVLSARQMPQRAPDFLERLHKRIVNAEHWMRRGNAMLVLMHGPSGSGKTWLSERLVPAIHAIRVRSDLERKRLAGLEPEHPAVAPYGQGIYRSEVSHRTYARLADCAETCLEAGFRVIVDAASLDAADRELLRALAAHHGAPFLIVSCQADPISLAAHVLDRSREHGDASNAELAVLDAQLRSIQPFAAFEAAHVLTVDTSEANAVTRVAADIKTRADAGSWVQRPSSPKHHARPVR